MANQYRIANYLISAQDEGFEELLATIHNTAYRPLCLCKGEPGIPMYVAHVGEHFIIKRMPDSGNQHAPDCNSFEPPCELSGLGDVLGSAIQCNEEDGTTSLKFDFSLSKTTGRTPTPGSGGEASSVRTDGKRLTLRGTLHYLWEEAGFNRWFPAMAGKRNWYTIHQHLLLAAEGKLSKGKPLSDTLFVPPPFFVDRKAEISHRRWERLTKVAAAEKGPRDLMLLIAEVKDIVPGRVGQKLIAKQLPDFPFLMDAQLHNRFMKAFKGEWDLFKAIDTTHLLAIGTFGVSPNGVASLEELSVIVVDEHWLPIESMFEKELVEKLTDQKRCFLKVLRYNLASNIPVAATVLLDTRPKGVAMYIIPPALAEDEEYKKGLEELIMASTLDAWVWLPGQGEMPPLPGLTEAERGTNPTLPLPVEIHSSPEPFPADSPPGDAAAPIPAETVRAAAADPIETIPPVPEESIHETPIPDMSDLPF